MGAVAQRAVAGGAIQKHIPIVPVIWKRLSAMITPSGFIHHAACKVTDYVTDGVNMAQIYAELDLEACSPVFCNLMQFPPQINAFGDESFLTDL